MESRLSFAHGNNVDVTVCTTNSYPILFSERYDIQELWLVIAESMRVTGTKQAVVVSDSNVGPVIGDRIIKDLKALGLPMDHFYLPAGEDSKNIDQMIDLWAWMKEIGVQRRSLVIGIGGGVVCDMTGMAAATYLRGLPYMLIPTSLLAQADAAVGGKVGVDFDGSKNWVGTFYHPTAIVNYTSFLSTLAESEFANGMAEIIKIALLKGDTLWLDLVRQHEISLRVGDAVLTGLIKASALAKLEFLAADPYEHGSLDRPLNLGHCIGHPVEAASGFGLRHGQAVAIGMTLALRIGFGRGLCDEKLVRGVQRLLSRFGLPTQLPSELLKPTWRRLEDVRKVRNGALRLVIPTVPGLVTFIDDLDVREFESAAGDG